MAYMGYEDLEKSDRLSIREVELLAIENGYDYSITDKGIRLIGAEGDSRYFRGNPKASTIGKFMGYSEGGSVKNKTGHTDLRKTGLFK
jgi:hypothetical protein